MEARIERVENFGDMGVENSEVAVPLALAYAFGSKSIAGVGPAMSEGRDDTGSSAKVVGVTASPCCWECQGLKTDLNIHGEWSSSQATVPLLTELNEKDLGESEAL